MSKPKLSPFKRTTIVLLTAWALMTVVPDGIRAFRPYATLGITADNDGKIYGSVSDEASSQGLRAGQSIDLHATALPDLLAVLGGMGGMQYVQPDAKVSLKIVSNSPGIPDATINLTAQQDTDWTPFKRFMVAIADLGGTLFILLGAILLWQAPSRMTWGFFLYAIWFNPGQYFVFYAELASFPKLFLAQEFAQSIAQAFGYAGFILFALRFPEEKVHSRLNRLEAVLPVVVCALSALQLASFTTAFGLRTEFVTRCSYICGYGVDLLALVILMLRKDSLAAIDKQRVRWILWGGWIGLLAFIFADSNEATTLWVWLWPDPPEALLLCFYSVNLTVAASIIYAVTRDRVINVSFAISRGTALLMLWILEGAVVSLLFDFAGDDIAEKTLHPSTAGLALLTVTLSLIGTRIHEWLDERCDRLFFRRLHDAEQHLREPERFFDGAKSEEDIERALIVPLQSCLRLASATVFRRHGAECFRRSADDIGWTEDCCKDIPASARIVENLASDSRPRRLEDFGRDQAGIPCGAEAPVLAVPIFRGKILAAIAFFSAHTAGDDLLEEEIDIIAAFALAAGVGFERIEADMMRQQIETLKQQLDFVTRARDAAFVNTIPVGAI